jgi:hypothetical protein
MKKVIYRIFDIFITIWDKVALLSALGLLLILVVTMIDVCIRPFDRSVKGSMELVWLLLPLLLSSVRKGCIGRRIYQSRNFKFGKLEFAIKILIEVLHFAIFAFVTYYCFEQSLVGLKMGTSSSFSISPDGRSRCCPALLSEWQRFAYRSNFT